MEKEQQKLGIIDKGTCTYDLPEKYSYKRKVTDEQLMLKRYPDEKKENNLN